jgi:hypothetical protein
MTITSQEGLCSIESVMCMSFYNSVIQRLFFLDYFTAFKYSFYSIIIRDTNM